MTGYSSKEDELIELVAPVSHPVSSMRSPRVSGQPDAPSSSGYHSLTKLSWVPGPIRVLVLEDDPGDAAIMGHMLREGSFRARMVETLADAVTAAQSAEFHIGLIDLTVPDSRGIEVVLRLTEACPTLPLVIISGCPDESLAVEAVRHGAQDFVLKQDLQPSVLGRIIRYSIERKLYETRLEYLAQHDPLTDLANRRLFSTQVARAMAAEEGGAAAVIMMDLDGFKEINDSFGHKAGDELLRQTARRLEVAAWGSSEADRRTFGTIARFGGDEFALLLSGRDSAEEVCDVARRINGAVAEPVPFEGRHLTSTASIGVALLSGGAESVEDVIRRADTAMYAAKRDGKNRYALA